MYKVEVTTNIYYMILEVAIIITTIIQNVFYRTIQNVIVQKNSFGQVFLNYLFLFKFKFGDMNHVKAGLGVPSESTYFSEVSTDLGTPI